MNIKLNKNEISLPLTGIERVEQLYSDEAFGVLFKVGSDYNGPGPDNRSYFEIWYSPNSDLSNAVLQKKYANAGLDKLFSVTTNLIHFLTLAFKLFIAIAFEFRLY